MPPSYFVNWIDRQRSLYQNDKAARWTIDVRDLKIHVDCTTAFTTQILHNVAIVPSRKERGLFDESFQESFWLRKSGKKGWQVAFWHATKVPKTTTGAGAAK